MKIIFSGGGTLGSVAPLLAIGEAIRARYPGVQLAWVGTKTGPERALVTAAGVPFFVIGAGKWRRYFSWFNLVDLFKIGLAFFRALVLLWQERPNLVVSAGGYVSVPLHWAAFLLGIPSWVHQQDVAVGFANKLMVPFATKITAALRETAAALPPRKTEWLGNPSRDLSLEPQDLPAWRGKFNLPVSGPVIFALGGGTGAVSVNKMVLDALPHWRADWQVIHLLGAERPAGLAEQAVRIFPNYHPYQFFTAEMAPAYALASVVIARAGFATLSELAALGKPAVIIPKAGTHQEANAQYLSSHKGIIRLDEEIDDGLKLASVVRALIENPAEAAALGRRLRVLLPCPSLEKILEIVEKLLNNNGQSAEL